MQTIGFIGTGGMGSGMATNLIKSGYQLVVNDLNRDQAKVLEDQGAKFVNTPREVAENSELVLSMLPNNDAVKTVGLGDGGLSEAGSGAKVWIDFSSIDKATISSSSRRLSSTRVTATFTATMTRSAKALAAVARRILRPGWAHSCSPSSRAGRA